MTDGAKTVLGGVHGPVDAMSLYLQHDGAKSSGTNTKETRKTILVLCHPSHYRINTRLIRE